MNAPTDWHGGGVVVSFRLPALLLAAGLGWIPAAAPAATNIVTALTDSGPGSLRQTILNSAPGDTITFAAGTGTIFFAQQIVIDKNLSILGPGTGTVAFSGNGECRLLMIDVGASLHLAGLTLRDGHSPNGVNGGMDPPTAGTPGEPGGAVLNAGTLALLDCVLRNNAAGQGGAGGASGYSASPGADGGAGGAIYSTGTLMVSNCVLFQNASGGGGAGGVATTYAARGGHGGRGGAICSVGPLALYDVVIRDNRTGGGASSARESPGANGGSGGGVWCGATCTASNAAFSLNSTGGGGSGGGDSMGAGSGGNGGSGGGLWCGGRLTLTDCLVTSNYCGRGGAGGGGIGALGYATSGSGGSAGFGCGIYCTNAAWLLRCAISDNRGDVGGRGGSGDNGASGGSGSVGAGIYATSDLTLNDSTVSCNTGGNGGEGGTGTYLWPWLIGGNGGSGGHGGSGAGVRALQGLAATNCTFSGNQGGNGGHGGSGTATPGGGGNGGSGGAIHRSSQQPNGVLVNCTITGNRTGWSSGGPPGAPGDDGYGGGMRQESTAELQVLNTLIAGNSGSEPDVSGNFISLGHNLVGATNGTAGFTAPGDRVGSTSLPLDARLGPLTNNGGPTLTHAPLPCSPAIDAGTSAGSPGLDQRGVPRPQGGGPDIGACEYQFTIPAISGAGFRGQDFWLSCCGVEGQGYLIEVSSDLAHWSRLDSFVSGPAGFFEYPDTTRSTDVARYYRLVRTDP